MTVYVSTGGCRHKSSIDFATELYHLGFLDIELTGGLHDEDFFSKLIKLSKVGVNFTLHNYLPFTAQNFVINLASDNEEVVKYSIKHVIRALEISNEISSQFYAVHAGFLIDPQPNELGNKLVFDNLTDHILAIKRFTDRVNALADVADRYGVQLLIENNVISNENLCNFPKNPLLMCNAHEMLSILRDCDEKVKLLLDVAHLKVSCNTLDLNPKNELEKIKCKVAGLHLSDNNGITDSNNNITENSWFMNSLPTCEYTVLEVYNYEPQDLQYQISLIR